MTPPAAAMPTVDAGRCFPAELLEQLKEQLPQVLFATLSDRVATYEEQFGAASQQLDTTVQQERVTVCATEDPGAGRTSASAADRQVRTRQ